MESERAFEARFKLRQVAFFGRTLAEYLQMFAIEVGDLRGRTILDVASGPGSFVAEAAALGLDATGCDPMYARDPDTIAAQGRNDIDACREQIRTNPGVLVYRDIERFYREKYLALERFAADFRRGSGEGRYVAGALPALPFEDRAFDLVLSGNFLMVYAPLVHGGMHDGEEFNLEFHERAFRELARVTRQEFRVTGMHTWEQPPKPHPYCGPVVAMLEGLGFSVALVPSDYDDGCRAEDRGERAGDRQGPLMHRVLVARRRGLEPTPR